MYVYVYICLLKKSVPDLDKTMKQAVVVVVVFFSFLGGKVENALISSAHFTHKTVKTLKERKKKNPLSPVPHPIPCLSSPAPPRSVPSRSTLSIPPLTSP